MAMRRPYVRPGEHRAHFGVASSGGKWSISVDMGPVPSAVRFANNIAVLYRRAGCDHGEPAHRRRGRGAPVTSADDSPVPDYASMLRLDGEGFVVVGAGAGMGRQTAHALASLGARILCVDIDPVLAREVAAEVGGFAWPADVRRGDEVERLVATAERELEDFRGIADVVGLHSVAALVDMPEDDWDWCHDMVVRHAFHLVKHGGRALAARGRGTIVFVSSVSGLSSSPYTGAYGAAKAALTSLVKTAAVELRASEVRVNAVAPGLIASPRAARRAGRPTSEMATGSLSAHGATSDVAAAILFLSSDLSRYMTGQTIVVDGGALVRFPFDVPAPPPGTVPGRGV
jgi:NAD(P)-dependent dehydrogenase (short-subunit alcohol dehydrogenase family)